MLPRRGYKFVVAGCRDEKDNSGSQKGTTQSDNSIELIVEEYGEQDTKNADNSSRKVFCPEPFFGVSLNLEEVIEQNGIEYQMRWENDKRVGYNQVDAVQ